jgi:hypothetical protein
MSILLVILLVVYFAAVSVPTSMRLIGLILARDGLRELPLPEEFSTVRSAPSRSVACGAPRWLRRSKHSKVCN